MEFVQVQRAHGITDSRQLEPQLMGLVLEEISEVLVGNWHWALKNGRAFCSPW
jgi:hypothetical protein